MESWCCLISYSRSRLTSPKHMRDVHGATRRRRTMNKLRKRHANPPYTRKQTIPGGPSAELPYVCLWHFRGIRACWLKSPRMKNNCHLKTKRANPPPTKNVRLSNMKDSHLPRTNSDFSPRPGENHSPRVFGNPSSATCVWSFLTTETLEMVILPRATR